jgi:hypothetical protein
MMFVWDQVMCGTSIGHRLTADDRDATGITALLRKFTLYLGYDATISLFCVYV